MHKTNESEIQYILTHIFCLRVNKCLRQSICINIYGMKNKGSNIFWVSGTFLFKIKSFIKSSSFLLQVFCV